jgi:hypothetical protein
VADRLDPGDVGRIGNGGESVVQRGELDPGLSGLPFGALVAVEAFSELSRSTFSSSVSGGVFDRVGDQVGVAGVQAGECVGEIDGDAVGQAGGEAEHAGFTSGARQLSSVKGGDRVGPVDGGHRGAVDQAAVAHWAMSR